RVCGGLSGHNHPFSRRGFSRASFANDATHLVTAGLDPAVHAEQRFCKAYRYIRLSFTSAWIAGSSPALTKARTREKIRKRNAGRRIVSCPHASGVRDAPRRKAACAALRLRARSPAGVPLAVLASGTFVPRAQRRARLPERRHKRKRTVPHEPPVRSQRC